MVVTRHPFAIGWVDGQVFGRGIGISPGGAIHETTLLQMGFGQEVDRRRHLLPRHLPVGRYRLDAAYYPRTNVAGQGLPAIVEATTVTFDVVARSPAEEAAYRRTETMHLMVWSASERGSYNRALMQWLSDSSRDSVSANLVAYVLTYGQMQASSTGIQPDALLVPELTRAQASVAIDDRGVARGAAAMIALARRDSSRAIAVADSAQHSGAQRLLRSPKRIWR